MKPNPKQIKWLKKYLPKDAVPLDVIPRAYCVLKTAPGSATFATPYMDYRKHLAKKETAKYCSGVMIDAISSRCVVDVNQGDWVTVVYAQQEHSAEWFCVPKLMPYIVFKE